MGLRAFYRNVRFWRLSQADRDVQDVHETVRLLTKLQHDLRARGLSPICSFRQLSGPQGRYRDGYNFEQGNYYFSNNGKVGDSRYKRTLSSHQCPQNQQIPARLLPLTHPNFDTSDTPENPIKGMKDDDDPDYTWDGFKRIYEHDHDYR